MKREGRFSEWQKALATVQQETGKKYAQVKYTAIKQCGYHGPDHERQLHIHWLAMEQAKSQLSVEQKVDADETFEAALAKLPLKADRDVELEWIMSHTALAPLLLGELSPKSEQLHRAKKPVKNRRQ